MNHLDDLRDAMHTTPDFQPKELDLDLVMAAGGRLRRRRRAVAGAAAGLAVLVVLVGGAQLARRDGPPAAGIAAAGPAPASATPDRTAQPGEPDPGAALGDIIKTGVQDNGLDQVLWMQRVDDPARPDISIGMVAGRRTAGGELIIDIVTNETDGSDRAPGFHGLEAPMVVDNHPTPAFGYYVGAATKITVTTNGQTIQARQAVWSEDPSVVLFWFPVKQVKPESRLGRAVAYDRNGRKLPAGNATFASG